MMPNTQKPDTSNATEKRFNKAAFLNDPFAPEFAEVRQAMLTHLRAKQEASNCVSTVEAVPVAACQEQGAIEARLASLTAEEQLSSKHQKISGGLPQMRNSSQSGVTDEQQHLPVTDGYTKSGRLLDILGVVLLLPIALVAVPITALAIKASSKGPVFSRIRRLGRGEKPFLLHRFRTTWVTLEPDQAYGAHLDDIAVTPLGVLLRNTKIERLPEIINIILGDMSLVGPRARHPWFARFMTPQQRQHIFSVRPGLIGPVQLRFRYERRLMACQTDKLGYFLRVLMPLQLRAEEEYLRHQSMARDLELVGRMLRVTCRNFGTRNRQVLKDWLEQGGQTEALVGKTLPSDLAVQEFYPKEFACMYTRRWECFAVKPRSKT